MTTGAFCLNLLTLWLCVPVVVGSCATDDRLHDGAAGPHRGLAGAADLETEAARRIVVDIGVRFGTRATRVERASASKAPPFGTPWSASFERNAEGALEAIVEAEPVPSIARVTGWPEGRRDRLASRFPAESSGAVRVEVIVSGREGAWIEERLAGASGTARAAVVDGRIVYAEAKPGIDRVYEVTAQRVEEYVQIADAQAADLQYEIKAGPAITDVVVDGSGAGLVALDANGEAVLKAPQPKGVDAKGAPVAGRFLVARVGEQLFSVRVRLVEGVGETSFPVLLDPGWVVTGSMATARNDHTATLLQNGKVLVAAGYDTGVVPSAELYDPASGTWSATGSMAIARYVHTATLLQNGKVLVAGGTGAAGAISSAELYDPVSGIWSGAGSAATPRWAHTATLLQNGQVVVAGGVGATNLSVSSAEIYDPVSDTWSTTGAMATPRCAPTATLLSSGKVLVAGGSPDAGASVVSSAELYDPAGGTWSTTGSMAAARYSHTASSLQSGKVLVAGGGNPAAALSSAELYDPVSATWSAVGPMTDGRFNHTATVVASGQILVAGGHDSSAAVATAELYDPASATWAATASMSTVRWLHAAALLQNGEVLVAGGYFTGSLSSAELYGAGPNGSKCAAPAACVSGFCVDGVCCNAACGGGVATDCQSCLGAMTGGADGTCGTVIATADYTCRTASGPCDVAGVCTGSATTCPADSSLPNGTPCGAGMVCSTGACSAACFIGGALFAATAANPANACQACAPATSTTSWSNASDGAPCNDGNPCTQTDACMAGVCTGSNSVVCTASDDCHTAGVCQMSNGICTNPAISDGTPCATGACVAGVCTPTADAGAGGAGGSLGSSTSSSTSSSSTSSSSASSSSASSSSASSSSTSASSTSSGTGGESTASSSSTSGGLGTHAPTPGGCSYVGGDRDPDAGPLLALGALAAVVASRKRRAPAGMGRR
jgi:MYXO-CTERM domain-containing protein